VGLVALTIVVGILLTAAGAFIDNKGTKWDYYSSKHDQYEAWVFLFGVSFVAIVITALHFTIKI
jgi:hypothetical protein